MSDRCQVFVGNIGMVFEGKDAEEARDVYDRYVESSKAPYGRASGEPVTMFCESGGQGLFDVEKEYYPEEYDEDE